DRIFGSRVALLAAAICPLIPQSIRYVGMSEVETLMGLFIVLLALTALTLVSQPTPRNGAAFGAVAAAATLTKPIVLIYPFVFWGFAAWRWKVPRAPSRQPMVASSVALACFFALLLPWSVRNAIVTEGKFKGISSNAPAEFLRGYVNAQPKYYLLRQDF